MQENNSSIKLTAVKFITVLIQIDFVTDYGFLEIRIEIGLVLIFCVIDLTAASSKVH